MKRLLLGILFAATGFSLADVAIVDYDTPHKDAVMNICLEDPLQFFCGSVIVNQGFLSADQFAQENKKGIEAILNHPSRVKKVIIDSGKVIGFLEFFKSKEQSLESIRKQMKEMNQELTPEMEAQIVTMMPQLKKTEAECEFFAHIECLAVSRDFRRRGHARSLIKHAIEYIKQEWPTLKRVELTVNANNEHARKLYESEGFILSEVQPQALVMLQVVQYEKAL